MVKDFVRLRAMVSGQVYCIDNMKNTIKKTAYPAVIKDMPFVHIMLFFTA